MITRPEVLAPAGDMECLNSALSFGADAVFLAGKMFGMRSASKNFDNTQLKQAFELAHAKGAKLYVTCNTLPRNNELDFLPDYLSYAQECGVDAFIIADLGVFEAAKKYAPKVARHISTQAGVTNYATANVLYNMGASRVVLAREIPLEEIAQMRAKIPKDLEIECFVHGAMCVSFSGRCLISSYMTGRDANHGDCAQPCRWKYHLFEENREGQYFPVEEHSDGTYLYNSRDLCMIEHMDDILTSGIDSLKIEGRMKTALYVATVARTYRKAIDDYLEDPKKYEANMPWYKDQISNCTYRQFTTGFYFGKPSEESQIYDSNTYIREYTYLGIIGEIKDGLYRIEQRNKFSVGEVIEIMKPDGQNVEATVEKIIDEDGNEQESAPHPKQVLYVALSADASVYDILRRAEKETE